MTEHTQIRFVDYLRPEHDWQWLPELNIILIRDGLTDLEVQDVLVEVGVCWRRSLIELVPATITDPNRVCPQAS